ncbi:hypothetical protein N7540_001198 [Penicillium herquei]|nr:hypothetical protein N7540_001198 [Penicillium herquei]
MRFILLAMLALVGAVMASPQSGGKENTKIPTGSACKQDGSMGYCESDFCLQTPSEATGVCK